MRKLAVIGAQESGVGAAVLARKLGIDVFVSDAGKIKDAYRDRLDTLGIAYEEGGHTKERVLDADEIVKSPGVPDTAPLVVEAVANGTSVISEIEFASRHTTSPIIGITGSNGKTTTTLLMGHILQKAGLDVAVGGNVGTSFAGLVADRPASLYVLELSSFQLDGIRDFRPHIAILLNITPDHLDRYQYKLENYAASKFRIALNQTEQDHFIHCDDDPETRKGLAVHHVRARKWPFSIQHALPQGGFLDNDRITVTTDQNQFHMTIHKLALQGKHNVYNSLAATIAARVLDIRSDVLRESLSDFQNVEHRLERAGIVNGVEFINDSKATNVNSVWYALECMTKPVVWIAGGQDKGNNYSEIMDLVKQKVKAIVCLGADNTKLHKAFKALGLPMVDTASAEEAVMRSYELAEPGDVVLLSPAGASFDLFANYEERGRRFKSAVRSL
jgi:UDP-N-acetylmuramoylalanine--D-glutamate ligase